MTWAELLTALSTFKGHPDMGDPVVVYLGGIRYEPDRLVKFLVIAGDRNDDRVALALVGRDEK